MTDVLTVNAAMHLIVSVILTKSNTLYTCNMKGYKTCLCLEKQKLISFSEITKCWHKRALNDYIYVYSNLLIVEKVELLFYEVSLTLMVVFLHISSLCPFIVLKIPIIKLV